MNKFDISKETVLDAYYEIRNQINCWKIDKEAEKIIQFGYNLEPKIHELWKRLLSGNYHPFPYKRYTKRKKNGTLRELGTPSVEDRIVESIFYRELKPSLVSYFAPSVYAYFDQKKAVTKAKQRCKEHDWVIILDIKNFTNSINQERLIKMLQMYTELDWLLLYIRRWMEVDFYDGRDKVIPRKNGIPTGPILSFLLGDLYLHHAFDLWMLKCHPYIPYERCVDDIICHCESEESAKILLKQVKERIQFFDLELQDQKTKIVNCNENFKIFGMPWRGSSLR